MTSSVLAASLETWSRSVIDSAGYVGLTAILAIESIFPPIPSEVVLPLAGFEVSRGTLTLIGALVAATLGSLIGALVLYAVGRFGGRPAIDRLARTGRISPGRIEAAERWFQRRGWVVVLFGRLVPGLRSLVSIPAGAAEMSLPSFSLLTVAGSAVWNAALIGLGVALGAHWEEVGRAVSGASTVVLAVLVFAGVGAGALVLRRRRRSNG